MIFLRPGKYVAAARARGSASLRLPWSPVVSLIVLAVSLLLAPCLPWPPWLPSWLTWSPVVSRFASRGLPLLSRSPVVSQTVNLNSLLFSVLCRQGVVVVVVP